MTKTIKEWLEELPEPYRTQALNNMEVDEPYSGDEETANLSKALHSAFLWDKTREGLDYWLNFIDNTSTSWEYISKRYYSELKAGDITDKSVFDWLKENYKSPEAL